MKKRDWLCFLFILVCLSSVVIAAEQTISIDGRPVVIESYSFGSLYGIISSGGNYQLILTDELQRIFLDLLFSEKIHVEGTMISNDVIKVVRLRQVLPPSGVDLPGTTGSQRTVGLFVKYSGDVYIPQMPIYYDDKIFGGNSVRSFWRQNSYSRMSVERGGALNRGTFGWYDLPSTLTAYQSRNRNFPSFMLDVVTDAILYSGAGILDGDRVIVITNRDPTSPTFAGSGASIVYLPIGGRLVTIEYVPPSQITESTGIKYIAFNYGTMLGLINSGSRHGVRDSRWDIMSNNAVHTNINNKFNAQVATAKHKLSGDSYRRPT